MADQASGRPRRNSLSGLVLAIFLAVMMPALRSNARAQVSGRSPSMLPHATIVSDEASHARGTQPVDDDGTPSPVAATLGPHSHWSYHADTSEPSYSAAVEPTHAMIKLKQDAWAYAGPEASSATLERVHAGKFLNVTGSSHYFLQVRLKSGATGYVPISAVELTRRQDKIMRLSTDAAVVSQPNRYGKRVSEVHQGHNVHVVGISMNYIKIRMKSGLEGYIPMTATE